MLRTCHPRRLCFSLVALAGVLLLATGCWTEVPYEEPAEESSVESEEPVEAPSLEKDPSLAEPEPIATPVEPDRYAVQEPPSDGPLPWETDSQSDDTSPEAERLFGETNEPIENKPSAESDSVEQKSEEEDSFESFLTEAYADLDNSPDDTQTKAPPREEEEIVKEEVTELLLPETFAPPATEPIEKEPTEEEPMKETESFESLFGNEPETTEPTTPEIETPAPRYAEEPTELPTPDNSVSELEPEPLPLPPKPPVVTKNPSVEVWPKIEPLPAVPVRTYNTRHLAWLLGGKLSLAQLAGAGGATPDEVTGWSEETRRLAEQLKVATPPGADPDAPAAERVGRLLSSAAAISAQLAEEHGTDHAALVEMALKSNALLVLHEERPDLTPLVARAVAAAANRAELPGYLWRDAVKTLERQPTVGEVFDAVTQLHADIEAYLR